MSISKAVESLRCGLDLCVRILDGETDPEIIKGMTAAIGEIETAIRLLEEEYGLDARSGLAGS